MMRVAIADTTLVITGVESRFNQESRVDDSGEHGATFALEDTLTGRKGQISVSQSYYKRDIDEQKQTTDNDLLFVNNHPECDWFEIGEFYGDDINPDAFVHFDHDLEYEQVDGKYGMWLENR